MPEGQGLTADTMTVRSIPRPTLMRATRTFSLLLLLGIVIPKLAAQTMHTTTDWDVRPSLKFDVICVLNVLSGDPYYLEYYKGDYERLSRQLRPEELAAFGNLKRRIKDQAGSIISAQLSLYFSASDAETLDELVRTVEDSSVMKNNLQATPYFSDDGWKIYEESRADLKVAFRALQRIHFEDDWRKESLPSIEKTRAAISADLPKYNVIPAIESALGSPSASNRITVYLLYYSKPHGIKITGTRFLSHYSYAFRIVLRNAVHEMMHPPYDPAHDAELRSDLDSLRSDPFFMNKVEHHNTAFGYNTPDGLAEEDSVQALEEVIAEHFGVGHDPRAYWREQDDGIHVFAVALYSLMKEQHFGDNSEAFPAFLKRNFREGRLSKGKIEQLNKEFFN
jgi:hypothetical protein